MLVAWGDIPDTGSDEDEPCVARSIERTQRALRRGAAESMRMRGTILSTGACLCGLSTSPYGLAPRFWRKSEGCL
jgi:hypothetical protein